jgi:regulatory protein
MAAEPDAPRVTSLRSGPKRGRQTVLLDDGRSFVFSDEACLRAGVRVGTVADTAYLQQLEHDDQSAAAHESALRLLSYRARSEREIRSRLRRQGTPEEVVDAELDRLRTAGLVDDEAFAKMWVEERGQLAPRGQRLLRNELRTKGIAAESIDVATESVDDYAAALTLARTRARKLAGLTYQEFRNKIGALLQRKGFDYATCAAVLREVWAEQANGSDDTGDPSLD